VLPQDDGHNAGGGPDADLHPEKEMDFPTVKTQKLYQQISQLIIDYIREGRFVPGQALPAERNLSKMLGVSRSSVREALIALEISGWVEIRVGNGVFVRSTLPDGESPADEPEPSFDVVSVQDLLRAREVVEGELAATAATNATDTQLAELNELFEAMKSVLDDTSGFHKLDKRFHVLIGEMTGNPLLTGIVEDLWSKRYTPMFLRLEEHYSGNSLIRDWDNDHQAIVAAIAARDARRARTAMRRHTRNIFPRLFRQTK